MTKRQLIMEKAIELFATQGIESTSVQQITELCGISKGAFYLSFKSKEELILSIIDHFMKKIAAEIDRVVRKKAEPQVKLYEYFLTTFQIFQEHKDFAKMFVKEHLQTVNKELLEKLNRYEELIDDAILRLLEELYGGAVEAKKYDLLFCMKGFIDGYAKIFFTLDRPVDLEKLSRSLAEKTNLLAKHSSAVFIDEGLMREMRHPAKNKITLPQVLEEIGRLSEEVEEPLERESLDLLAEQLQKEKPSRAIVFGLLQNLKNDEKCGLLIFLVNRLLDQ